MSQEHREQSEQPQQLSLDQRIAQAGKLLSDFKHDVTAIPDAALAEIGYIRFTKPDGDVSLILIEKLPEFTQRRERENNKKPPFEPVTFELNSTGKGFRSIQYGPETEILASKLEDVEEATIGSWHYELPLGNLGLFLDDFEDVVLQLVQESDKRAVNRLLHFPLPDREKDRETYFNADFFFADYKDGDTLGVKADKAGEMYAELSRLAGHYGDIPELQRIFKKSLSESADFILYDLEKAPLAAMKGFFSREGIATFADFIRFAFPLYLDQIGLPEMGKVIRGASDLTGISDQLMHVKIPASAREKDIRQELREADQQKRVVLNEELKTLEVQRKRLEKLRMGVINYLNAPVVYVQLCKQHIQVAQDLLVAGKKEQSTSHITLDPTPSPELDKNPGKVSGDCTEDRPLPFYREDTHNVKVFRGTGEKKKHIGNMYLLETSDDDRKVWHFDAIQIPWSSVDWNHFLERIVAQLATQAKANGIEAITVNGDTVEHLSNYDYIQDAIKRYWETTARKTTEVEIPLIEDSRYSNFQGDGHDLVLWSKK